MNPLLVPELFRWILSFLAIPLSAYEDRRATDMVERKTLVSLACTCRAFSEPSLDRLWRRLESLVPLVRSFADVVDDARVRNPPSPSEWLVMNRHTPRIRELTLGTERLSLEFLGRTKLDLPNLAVLRWKCHGLGAPRGSLRIIPFCSIVVLRSLLTPKIVALEAMLDSSWDPYAESFLEDFPRLCPNLKSITLDITSSSGQVSEAAKQALSRAICSHGRWQHVRVSCPIDRTALKHLGTSSTLETVSLALVPEAAGPAEGWSEKEDTPFCNVTRLALILRNHLDFATHLLRTHGQAFRSFDVTIENARIAAMDVSALFKTIASPERMHSLQSLEVTCVRSTHFGGGGTQGLSYEHISPIASLVHLRSLVIAVNHPIAINDDEFTRLVRNWSDLEFFWWVGRCDSYPEKQISLSGLLSLLASCRRVRTIRLSLDARQVPVDVDEDICSLSVAHLLLYDSPIEEPMRVGKFLSKHLPCAFLFYVPLNLELFGAMSEQYADMWPRVVVAVAHRRRRKDKRYLVGDSLQDSATSLNVAS